MEWLIRLFGLTPTLDSVAWTAKWTTKLAALQGAFAAALAAWVIFDESMKATFPGWVPQAIGGGMMVTAFLQAFAPNVRQQKVADKVEAKTGIVPPAAPPKDPPS